MARDTWNDATIYTLKKLWSAGVTAGVIATRLAITRNAVVGKIHRMGLSLDPNVAKARRQNGGQVGPGSSSFKSNNRHAWRRNGGAKTKPAPAPGAPEAAVPPPTRKPAAPVLEDPAVYAAARKPLRDLEPNECKWPIGDPQDKRFGFCAEERVAGKPYCAAHCRVAYVAPEVVRRQAAERQATSGVEIRKAEEVA